MNNTPLADRMRPHNLSEFVGQNHLLDEGKILRTIITSDNIPSMIFWGPPGTGKTTLASIIANDTNSEFVKLSATLSGVKNIREVVEKAKELKKTNRRTILFIDEIHRFNKSQQDSFLPHVEDGTITLIGATTENPSFEVNSALLSRTRVFSLQALLPDEIKSIIKQSINDHKRGLGSTQIKINAEALDFLSQMSNGDARVALSTLELAVSTKPSQETIVINVDDLKQALQKEHLIYDQTGEEHYNTISAFIKSMRASDADAALYYLARMIVGGEDPKFIARRMVIFASEDIGVAQPTALVVANEVFRACETIGYPECQINLAHGTIYLCQAKKDRSAYNAYFKALDDVNKHGNLAIPLSIRNAPTKLMKDMGYGKNYDMYPKNKSLLPEKLQNRKYLK